MRLRAARTLGRLARRIVSPLLPLVIRPARAPGRLLIAPQDIRVADPTIANDIYAGHFALAGRIVNGHGRSPFAMDAPSDAWARALHGFAWLRHLRAADTALARANARALIDDWIAAARYDPQAAAWQPSVVARRLISWLSHSPVVLEGAETRFYRRLMKSLMQQAAVLQRAMAAGLSGSDRLWAALALAEIALCVDRSVSTRRRSGAFLDELGRQVLDDGGHVSRDPQMIVDLLLDLLPLRQAYAARGTEIPAALLNAIDRMMPMLRLFRQADGALALFNGMGVTEPEAVATILAYDDARASPIVNAPYSGYQRIEAGDSVLICDTGPPPPPDFSTRAHAGTLSFEFSTAGQPMIVNCGRPGVGSERGMVAAARSTAAHSVLVLADTSSSRFAPAGWRGADAAIVSGPTAVPVTRDTRPAATIIEASHDGYVGQGYLHRRRLALAETGFFLSGEDELVPATGGRPAAEGTPFALRFHLHPLSRATYAADGRGVIIALGRGGHWRFDADGFEVSIEESIYFASPEGPRRTEQLVVQGTAPMDAGVRWSFAAVAGG